MSDPIPEPPDGYIWKKLPGDVFGLGTLVIMCGRCGAMIADHVVHDGWHEQTDNHRHRPVRIG